MLPEKERLRLRDLAKRQIELAESERNRRLYTDWEAHGCMAGNSRPMVTVELWSFANEIIPPMMACESPEGRSMEYALLSNTVNFELFHDDTVVRNYMPNATPTYLIPFGLPSKREETGGLGHQFISQISDLRRDFHKLKKSETIQYSTAPPRLLTDTIGDILPERPVGSVYVACPLQDIVHIMSMEDMYVAMLDEPELFHKMMDMLTNDYISLAEQRENEGLLPTNGDLHLPQGGCCFTGDLPSEGERLKNSQIWACMDAQEAAGISPAMYHEFVYPYYKRISRRFGHLSYGCCEAVHPIWEDVSSFDNLRKVSISPWCDEVRMGEALRGRRVVYLRKPSSNFLGVGGALDESAVREYIKATLRAARGCVIEFIQRDVYTISGNVSKVQRYVQILRESIGD